MKISRRILALFLCVLMCVSMFPAQVFAEETNSADFGDSEEITGAESAPTEPETPAEEPSAEAGDSPAEPDHPADSAEQPAENEAVTEAEIEEETVSNDAAMAPANSCGDNLTWNFDEDSGTLTISGSGKMTDWMDNTETPWYTIYSSIKSVVIEDGVESIGSYAFFLCTNLASVTIGNDVESIGTAAFQYCYKLTNLTIGSSVRTIGGDAFEGCKKLTEITVPASVESIGLGAFSCSALTAINVNADNAYYSSSDGVLFDKAQKTLVTFPRGKSGSYTIPDTVTVIGDCAFYCCSNLTSITIPDSVTTIGEYAFEACYGLMGVIVPAGVTKIGNYAFSSCSNLYNVIFLAGAAMGSESNIFYGDTLTAYYLSNSTGWTDEVMSACGGNVTWVAMNQLNPIDGSNLCWCLENGTLTIVGTGDMPNWSYGDTPWFTTLAQMQSIYTIVIGEGVTSVGSNAFRPCTNLTNVSLPSTLKTIGKRAFCGCSSLTGIVLPDGLESIGDSAFTSCTKLADINLPASLGSIGGSAFWECAALTSISIPDTITSIGDEAFYGCKGLTNVTLPGGLTSISNGMFYGCTGLEIAYISSGTNTIGDKAFSGCENLNCVVIPSSVTSIGSFAFYNCSKLKLAYFTGDEPNLASIGSYAFFGCTVLPSIDIHARVTYIGENAFAFSGLTKIYFKGDAPTFDGSTIFNSDELTAYYPMWCNWPADVMQDYGGTVTWKGTAYAPVLQSVANTDDSIALTWTAVTGANSYEVYRSTDSGETWFKIGNTSNLTYTDTSASSGTEYQYAVRAYNKASATNSELSNAMSIMRMTAPEISVTNESGNIKITWSTVTGADSYEIYRLVWDDSTGTWVECSQFPRYPSACGYTDDVELVYGAKYQYKVRGYDEETQTYSEFSDAKIIVRLAAPALTDIRNTDSSVKLTWTAVDFADSYNVYRSTDSGKTWSKIGNTSNCTYIDTTASSGKEYQYAVRACDSSTESLSAESNSLSITYEPTVMLEGIFNKTEGIKITWKEFPGATSYNVYRQVWNATKNAWSTGSTKIGSTTNCSYTDQSVNAGVEYRYAIEPDNGTYDITAGLSIIRLTTPTAYVNNGTEGIKITWSAVTGADGYNILRMGENGMTKIADVTGNTAFIDTYVSYGTVYQYAVVAFAEDKAGTAAIYESAHDETGLSILRLAAPELTEIRNTDSGVKLTWTAVDFADSYNVYQSIDSGKTWSEIGNTSNLTYIDTEASSSKEYQYVVKAYYSGTKTYSAYSNSLSITYTPTPVLESIFNEANGVKITWKAYPNAGYYIVMRKGIGDTVYSAIGTTSDCTYIDTGVSAGSYYTYTIKAVDKYKATESAFDETGLSITYYAPGDVNGDGAVNLKDLLMLKEALANGTADRLKYSSGVDVNNDGSVNLKDLLILKRTLAGVEA